TASATATNTTSATASSKRSILNVLYGGRNATSSVPAETTAVSTAAMRPPAHAATTTGTTRASASVAVLVRARNGTRTALIATTSATPRRVAPRRPAGRREVPTGRF